MYLNLLFILIKKKCIKKKFFLYIFQNFISFLN